MCTTCASEHGSLTFFFQPYFDMFYNHVKNLFASDATLSQLEKSSLMESLILISNQFKDFAKEKAFLDELMSSVVAQWTSDEMKTCVLSSISFALFFHPAKIFSVTSVTFYSVLCDPAAFLSYAGADQVVTEKSEGTDTAGLNRARVSVLKLGFV